MFDQKKKDGDAPKFDDIQICNLLVDINIYKYFSHDI